MIHATDGPASAWAKQAKPGDKIIVGGPGPIPKSHLYISSYWKIGNSEDQHKVVKGEDARQEELGSG